MIHPPVSVSRRALLGAAATVPAAVALAGCTGGGAAVRAGVDQVTFVTGFSVFGREAGVFVADRLGLFAEQHIEVDIQPGEGAASNTALVVGGRAQFSLTDMAGAIVLAGNGQAEGFRVVAAVHQIALIGFLALAESGIDAPQDLEGRRVADSSASVGRLLWPAYADLAGINAAEVELVDAAPPQLPGLLAAETVDAIGQYAVGLPTIETAAEGREAIFLPYSDWLTELYGITLICSHALTVEDPDLVRRFTGALLGGIQYALDNPQEAGQILADAVADGDPQTAQVAAAELQVMRTYVIQPNVPVGHIDPIRVSQSIALIEAVGTIPAGLTTEQIVALDLIPTG